jgi:CRP/FNR family cyclic AMP-dependent transcriptional regulator
VNMHGVVGASGDGSRTSAFVVKTLQRLIAASTWGRALPHIELLRVQSECVERRVAAGDCIAHAGEPSDHWIGMIDGLGKMSVSSQDRRTTTLAGISSGAWFGEGSVLKNEHRRYDAVALRPSRVALMPRDTFMRLREHSLPFNHYVQNLLNARLGWFIGLLEHERLTTPEARLARCLASFLDPAFYPEPGSSIALSQQEIALLCGISRQRTNVALQELQRRSLIHLESQRVAVLDVDGLRRLTRGAPEPGSVRIRRAS